MLAAVPCNLCKVDDATEVFGAGVAQRHRIVQCNRCGLLYATPRRLEPEHHGDSPDQEISPSTPHIVQRLMKEKIQTADYAPTMTFLAERYPRRGRLLEIGSGFGYLLTEFRKHGWTVAGIDPYAAACNFARSEHDLDVTTGFLENAGVADEAYDVVIMNHVIEHIPDPLATLCEIHRILEPGGHFVAETPRYDSLSFKVLGRRERSVSCDGHIYFFTNTTLRALCETAGFETVRNDYVGRTLTMDRLLWNIGVMSKSRTVQTALDSLSLNLGLDKARIYLNFKDMQRIYLRKPRASSGQVAA